MKGGCDSFNLLIPHSECNNGEDMYEEYKSARGKIAMDKNELLIIDDASSSQVCQKFGLHPKLPALQNLYQDGDALFIANAGHSYKNFEQKSEFESKDPMHSFAHNLQRERVERVDPFETIVGTGVLGRIADAMAMKIGITYVNSFAIKSSAIALENTLGKSKKQSTVSGDGEIQPFNPSPSLPDMSNIVDELNTIGDAGSPYNSGKFGQEWSSTLLQSLEENENLRNALNDAETTVEFPETKIGEQMEVVARLIKSHNERGVERDVFNVGMTGFDTHSEILSETEELFSKMNDALEAFANEMGPSNQNQWDNIVLVSASEFGRTLTPNSKSGTDHAWGGNYFVLGGSVKGGQILGQYPDNLKDSGPLNVGRGRVIPTTSWESIWHGIADWLEVADDLAEVIPNYQEFSHKLFTKDILFE